jgi:hypothetical protein
MDAFFGIGNPYSWAKEAQIFNRGEIAIQIGVVGKKTDVPPRLFRFFADIDPSICNFPCVARTSVEQSLETSFCRRHSGQRG